MFYNWNWSKLQGVHYAAEGRGEACQTFSQKRVSEQVKLTIKILFFSSHTLSPLASPSSELYNLVRVSALGSPALVTHQLRKDLLGAIHHRGHTVTWG